MSNQRIAYNGLYQLSEREIKDLADFYIFKAQTESKGETDNA